jgi:hypothetical protein
MPVTTLSSGEVVVPMSSILDALEGVLTEAERQVLFTQLINLRPAGVAPGDLITAELFNEMMSDINELMVRVAALEGGQIGPPVISEITPLGQKAGQIVTIIGQNLDRDRLDRIQFDNVDVPVGTVVDGGSSTRILVPVPAVPNIGTSGRFVEVSVSNASGVGRFPYFLAPATSDALVSNFVISYVSGFPLNVPVAANADVTLNFNIVGSASKVAAFTVVPTIDPPTAGWTVSMDVGDELINAAGNNQIQSFPVQAKLHTGASGAAAIKIAVRAQSNQSIGSEQVSDTFTVGANPPLSIPGIIMQGWQKNAFANAISISGNNVYFDDSIANTDILIKRTINISNGKTFTVGAPQLSPNSGWTAVLDPAMTVPFNGAASAQHELKVRLRCTGTFASATPTALDRQLVVPLSSSDGTVQAIANIKVRADHTAPNPA